jgi:hypothetical protein
MQNTNKQILRERRLYEQDIAGVSGYANRIDVIEDIDVY